MGAKIALFGGGGFRTPLVYQALARTRPRVDVGEVVLHDVDAERLRLMLAVVTALARELDAAPPVSVTTDPAEAADNADVVCCAIRVGGTSGRVVDERVALERGLLGQETVGPGGIAKALRTVPVVDGIARVVRRRAPRAWFVNFTNPAGLVTEALRDELGDRVVGICDTPAGLCRRVALAVGRDPNELVFDYAGLNHLGWLTAVRDGGGDLLPRLLVDDEALRGLREARLFGADRLRRDRAVPNEYLAYYHLADRVIERLRRAVPRGQYLLRQQRAFYSTDPRDPADALGAWRRARAQRSASYLAEVGHDGTPRAGGTLPDDGDQGYGPVAAAFAGAALTGTTAVQILNVANRTAVPFLPPDAVVEVPCVVTKAGAAPLAVASPPPEARELMATVKDVERLAIRAARTRSADLAMQAFARHPLVPTDDARYLLEAYGAAHPELRELFNRPGRSPS